MGKEDLTALTQRCIDTITPTMQEIKFIIITLLNLLKPENPLVNSVASCFSYEFSSACYSEYAYDDLRQKTLACTMSHVKLCSHQHSKQDTHAREA